MNAQPEQLICLVTGASRGIGKAIALTLATAGHTVIGTATTDKGADSISGYLDDAGHKGKGMALDVTSDDSVKSVMTEISEQFGAPLVLVNNAGITRDNLLMRMKDDEWDAVLDTNLKSVYRMSKACLRGMTKARYGRIVNISSVVGSSGNPGQVNYSAAKSGLTGFSKSLAQEVALRNITVNLVAPGFVETDMTAALSDDQKQALLDKIPLARLGQPDDIANAVGFLVSPGAGYVTGTTIHVNGGMLMD